MWTCKWVFHSWLTFPLPPFPFSFWNADSRGSKCIKNTDQAMTWPVAGHFERVLVLAFNLQEHIRIYTPISIIWRYNLPCKFFCYLWSKFPFWYLNILICYLFLSFRNLCNYFFFHCILEWFLTICFLSFDRQLFIEDLNENKLSRWFWRIMVEFSLAMTERLIKDI